MKTIKEIILNILCKNTIIYNIILYRMKLSTNYHLAQVVVVNQISCLIVYHNMNNVMNLEEKCNHAILKSHNFSDRSVYKYVTYGILILE